jgi:hypothetical protein
MTRPVNDVPPTFLIRFMAACAGALREFRAPGYLANKYLEQSAWCTTVADKFHAAEDERSRVSIELGCLQNELWDCRNDLLRSQERLAEVTRALPPSFREETQTPAKCVADLAETLRAVTLERDAVVATLRGQMRQSQTKKSTVKRPVRTPRRGKSTQK